jgi:hypothetical protein
MIRFGDSWVCANCKPFFVQKLKEGIPLPRSAFRDLSGLTRRLKVFLIVNIVVVSLALLSDFLAFRSLQASAAGDSEEALSSIDAVLGLLQLGVYITAGVLFLRWIYFANSNARALGASNMEFSPGWSVGWYFIPFANLWKPYQAMKEIWQASCKPKGWQHVAVPSIFPLWWTLWILASILSQASLRATMRADKQAELMLALVLRLLSGAADIPLTIVAIRLVSRIWEVQARRYQEHLAAAVGEGGSPDTQSR